MNRFQRIILASVVTFGTQSAAVNAGSFFTNRITTPLAQTDNVLPLEHVRFSHQRLRNSLEGKGFTNIIILDRRLFSSTVEACKDNDKMWLKVSNWGRIKRRRKIGSCGRRAEQPSHEDNFFGHVVKPPQLRRLLRHKGFRSIHFTDRRLPVYEATACKGSRKINLRINRRGRIIDRNLIGRCDDQRADNRDIMQDLPSLPQIRKKLRKRGYRQIHYTDRTLPRYVATACRRGAKFRLAISGWGEVKRRSKIGWCTLSGQAKQHDYDTPKIYYDDEEISGSYQLSANQCQNQMEYLIDRNKIYFDIDSDRIKRRSYRILRKLAHVMKRCPSASIEVAGHTDSVGSDSYNYDLSHRRAHSVKRELIDLGVRSRRLIAKGYGENHPVGSNATNKGKARNRRIDFIVSWEDEDEYAGR